MASNNAEPSASYKNLDGSRLGRHCRKRWEASAKAGRSSRIVGTAVVCITSPIEPRALLSTRASSLVLLGEFLDVRFSMRIEARLVAFRPGGSLIGAVDTPIGTATLQHGAHIHAELLDGWPSEEPVAGVGLIDTQTGLEHHGMGDHRIVIRVGIFSDVQVLLHRPAGV